MQLKRIRIPSSDVAAFCDVSTPKARPFVPRQLRRLIFEALHGLSHPGMRATAKLVKERYVWP